MRYCRSRWLISDFLPEIHQTPKTENMAKHLTNSRSFGSPELTFSTIKIGGGLHLLLKRLRIPVFGG